MNEKHKRCLTGGLIAAAALVAVLWSWNTLAGLFGLPVAQVKHVVAALLLLGTLRYTLVPRTSSSRRGEKRHGHPTH